MITKIKMWRFSAILFVLALTGSNLLVNGEPKVPCFFIFGDSLSDAGNNNDLDTMAKANYAPYGVDFPGKIPTGRFTNGRNIVDFYAQYLGFKEFIRPYSTEMGQDMLRGINFASGSAGILNESGSHLGDRVWMDRQLQYYDNALVQLQSMVDGPVANYLSKCLYTVNIGSNDYINNYFMPRHYSSSKLYTPQLYASLLIAQYKYHLKALYDSGARKIAVFGLGQIGCIPAELIMNNSTRCVDDINQAVELFNTKLISLVDYFNSNFPKAKFTFINLSAMQAISPLGFLGGSPCCKLRSDYMCEPSTPPCFSRNLHAFMDGFHPTEIQNEAAATVSYNTPLPLLFVHPMSIRQLIKN